MAHDHHRHPIIKLQSGAFSKRRIVMRDDFISIEEAATLGYDEIQRIFYDEIFQLYRYAGRISVGAPHYVLSSLLMLVAVIISLAATLGGNEPVVAIFVMPLPTLYVGWAIYRGLIAREVMLKIVYRGGTLVVPGSRSTGGLGRSRAQQALLERLHVPVRPVTRIDELGHPQTTSG